MQLASDKDNFYIRPNIKQAGLNVKRVLAVVLIVISIFVSCRSADENPLRDASRFAEMYAEVLVATRSTAHRANASAGLDSAARRAQVDSVLAAHRVNRQQLAEAVSYFGENPQLWQKVYQSVIQKLDSLSRRTDDRVPHSPPQSDKSLRSLDKKEEQN